MKGNKIEIYCKCYICSEFFEVTNKRISKFCSPKCKQKNYRIMKTTIIAILLLIVGCQKEQCFDFTQTTTTSISPAVAGYPKTDVYTYTTCGITKKDAKKYCTTTTSKTYQNFYTITTEIRTTYK